ncbi:putative coiled coil protein [Cryptosporidium canis]|uniref:Coiled coil protein n=1 Tax=Cryptosporidium canis TaxID=195482 RepID=A0ABQ8P4J5_9CRYT|nr:putative coiled coil protein [Cryptosporidium canis]KAJ1613854.1 putative coiled coil protein [Cryptosporidium canis]
MPILRDELSEYKMRDRDQEVIVSKFKVEKKERLSFVENNTRNEFASSLKKIEDILISAYDQASSNYNSFFYNINMLTLPYSSIEEKCRINSIQDDVYGMVKTQGCSESEESHFRMKILQGVNTELNDSLRMTLGVVIKTYKELENIQNQIEDLIKENSELRSEKFQLNISIEELKNENNKLSRENFYLNEQLKERISTCDKYKNALNKSIKTMKKLYFENDHFNKEINQLENQLVVSKLRVAQHNEELEHIRTLLKYYKNQVNSDYILSPAIEQIIKVEPCRIPSNSKQGSNCNNKTNHISSILSKLLFNNGTNTSRNTYRHKNKKVSLVESNSNNNSPTSLSPCLKPKNNKCISPLTTPIKLKISNIDESYLQSTGIDYSKNNKFFTNTRISRENLLSSEDEQFIDNLNLSPTS